MNIINAIVNIIKDDKRNVKSVLKSKNIINSQGTGFEEYIKDAFASTIGLRCAQKRKRRFEEVFSYEGNDVTPPDFMLSGGNDGDAVEVKKITGVKAELQLNSSMPEQKLLKTNSRINDKCKNPPNDPWEERDHLYIVGTVQNGVLRHVSLVYGTELCAKESKYLKVQNKIKSALKNLSYEETNELGRVKETNELGRVNSIDPLQITKLRIRGMWLLKNPREVFKNLLSYPRGSKFSLMAIISERKWESLPNRTELEKLKENCENLCIKKSNIINPDNPKKCIKAKVITYFEL